MGEQDTIGKQDVTLTIRLGLPLRKQASAKAIRDGFSLSGVVRTLLRRYVAGDIQIETTVTMSEEKDDG